ncbi:MAG: peptide-methionine (R)-S-oxide reductase MsrB [Nitrososphaerales archaeon]
MAKKGFVYKKDEEWKKQLTQEQYEVCIKKGTERPFTGEYCNCKDKGIYKCICCGNELFLSETKYDSGTGWPSFWAPINPENVQYEIDNSYGMERVGVLCSRCGAHLGHVFDDGPTPSNKRFCINSVALNLAKKSE